MESIGLDHQVVEQAIRDDILSNGAPWEGGMGRENYPVVNVSGVDIEYRPFTTADGVVHVGTYSPAPYKGYFP